MKEDEYARLLALSDRDLYDFVTETDASQRKWAALHILEARRNKVLTYAAKSSARAAWIAAGIAGLHGGCDSCSLHWLVGKACVLV